MLQVTALELAHLQCDIEGEPREQLTETIQPIQPPETYLSMSLMTMCMCLIGCGWPSFLCTALALLLSLKVAY